MKQIYRAYKRAVPNPFAEPPTPTLEDCGKSAGIYLQRLKRGATLRKQYTNALPENQRDFGHEYVVTHMENDIRKLQSAMKQFHTKNGQYLTKVAKFVRDKQLDEIAEPKLYKLQPKNDHAQKYRIATKQAKGNVIKYARSKKMIEDKIEEKSIFGTQEDVLFRTYNWAHTFELAHMFLRTMKISPFYPKVASVSDDDLIYAGCLNVCQLGDMTYFVLEKCIRLYQGKYQDELLTVINRQFIALIVDASILSRKYEKCKKRLFECSDSEDESITWMVSRYWTPICQTYNYTEDADGKLPYIKIAKKWLAFVEEKALDKNK